MKSFRTDDLGPFSNLEQRIPIVPCDSPIEDIFLWEFRKVAHDQVRVWRQYKVQTYAGLFEVDFALGSLSRGPLIGIECDGRDFHSASRDANRDLAIVRTGPMNKVYRLRGFDITFRIHDIMQILCDRERWAFSSRGVLNIDVRCQDRYLRNDEIGPWNDETFPFAAIRWYTPIPGLCSEEEEVIRARPTVICWTELPPKQDANQTA